MKALLDTYSDLDFIKIVKNSSSYSELCLKLGYKSKSGVLVNRIKIRMKELNLNENDFSSTKRIKRSEENIFIENSTADQKTLRVWYAKGNYTEYKCSICGQLPEWQNKPMSLILDHINGNNKDDRLENLRWVCPNCNSQLSATGSKNPNRKNVKKYYYCIDCGKEISRGSIRCQSCDAKNRTIALEDMPVSREELKNLIRVMPFTRIGEKYKVTDNAIRKWCDKFNLPRKASEIKQYTDEEWEKI